MVVGFFFCISNSFASSGNQHVVLVPAETATGSSTNNSSGETASDADIKKGIDDFFSYSRLFYFDAQDNFEFENNTLLFKDSIFERINLFHLDTKNSKNFWLNPLIHSSKMSRMSKNLKEIFSVDERELGYESDFGFGVIGGFDWNIERLLLGISASYMNKDIKYKESDGKTKFLNYALALHSNYNWITDNKGAFIGAFFSISGNNANKEALNKKLKMEYSNRLGFNISGRFGYSFAVQKMMIRPYLEGSWNSLNSKDFDVVVKNTEKNTTQKFKKNISSYYSIGITPAVNFMLAHQISRYSDLKASCSLAYTFKPLQELGESSIKYSSDDKEEKKKNSLYLNLGSEKKSNSTESKDKDGSDQKKKHLENNDPSKMLGTLRVTPNIAWSNKGFNISIGMNYNKDFRYGVSGLSFLGSVGLSI